MKFSRLGDLTPGICAALPFGSDILVAAAFQTSLTGIRYYFL
jgi:hypothetical protein